MHPVIVRLGMKGPHHETLRLLHYDAHELVALAKHDKIADAAAPRDIETQVQLQRGRTGL